MATKPSETVDVPADFGDFAKSRGSTQKDPENRVAQAAWERVRQAIRAGGGHTAMVKKTGIPGRTLSNLQAGQDPKLSQLLAIAGAAGVSLEWLASGTGPMHARDAAESREEKPASQARETGDLRLTQSVNVDQLIGAFGQAWETLKASGHLQDLRLLMHLTLANYDMLTHAKVGRTRGSEDNPQFDPQKHPQET